MWFKIFFITCSYPDDSGCNDGIFIHNQAKALNKMGCDVSVLLFDFRSLRKKRRIGLTSYIIDGIKVYRCAFPCGPFPHLLSILTRLYRNKLFQFAVKHEGYPDYIHAHFFDAGFIAAWLRKKYNISYFVTEHSSGYLSKDLKKRDYKIAKISYDNANEIISVGTHLKEQIDLITNKKVIVVPNIIPNYFFSGDVNDKDGDYTFVSVGNLIERKRFDLTIRAFATICKKAKNAKLLIIGQGPLYSNLLKIVSELDLNDRVSFLGPVNNETLPSVFRKCDCFVLPSEFETFGMVYAEAMACGLPVIATKCGGPEDFVNDNNGVLINKNCINELSSAMEYTMNNKKKYIHEDISNYCLNMFSENRVAEKIIKEYLAFK